MPAGAGAPATPGPGGNNGRCGFPSIFPVTRAGRRDNCKASSRIAHRELSQEQHALAYSPEEEVYRKQQQASSGGGGVGAVQGEGKAASGGNSSAGEKLDHAAAVRRRPRFWHSFKLGRSWRSGSDRDPELLHQCGNGGSHGAAERADGAAEDYGDGTDDGAAMAAMAAGSMRRTGAAAAAAAVAVAATEHGGLPGATNDEVSSSSTRNYAAAVERLQHGSVEEQARAAWDVRAWTRDDPAAREALGSAGAIPPLVRLLDAPDPAHHNAAVLALLNLAIGNDRNKAAVTAADALPRLVDLLTGSPSPEVQANVAAALLSMSALDANKPLVGSSGAVPGLVKLLKQQHGAGATQQQQEQGIKDAVGALYNVSLHKPNVALVAGCGAVAALVAAARDWEFVRDKALAVLGNLAAGDSGRRAIGGSKDAVRVLVDALGWADFPLAQERAVFVLMVLGHRSRSLRAAMARAGAVSALLELALLGSPLAQKRATKLLDCFREDRDKGRSISAPMVTGALPDHPEIQEIQEAQEEVEAAGVDRGAAGRSRPSCKQAVDCIVQRSLERNFKTMVKRANLPSSSC